jgi:murein DD-endopeptidase
MKAATLLLSIVFYAVTFTGHCQQAPKLLDVKIPWAPEPVVINGKNMMYYELHVVNLSADSIDLRQLEIADSAVIFSFGSLDLSARFTGTVPSPGKNILAPGLPGVIYLEYPLPRNRVTTTLNHRFDFNIIQNGGLLIGFAEGCKITLSEKLPIVLGSPLGKGNWAAVYDPQWERGHRRVIYTVGKQKYIPGRFAIDFIKLDNQGRYANGDENKIKNWLGYGADVYAVADGTIAASSDNFKESATLSDHPKYTSGKATGNYISLDIGDGRFVFYEHLKPGSIKVTTGQKVKEGDVIASLGFTGQSTGPHLHFHVANANSPLGAEGIPFVFKSFSIKGTYDDFSKFGKSMWSPGTDASSLKIKERPASNSVIGF